ncbi:RDD family protein [Paraglaciecola hydrolytica]|uniref:RDD domain-containing protein n=1 Tax=Paraglaciecola hydrolytica TaxID=1799789 RepID=A0A136A6D8_9ALTE|nr:RDD family protein [Paraglaciecola hydrolytica]KXI30799.1 hypothetical protein AX660_05155 [Paraglaciecola hydrolytica]
MEKISNNSSLDEKKDTHHLSQKETRQIVTPYAFHVSPELFGTALARPKKRAMAIGIDLLLVAILSQSASFVLAGVAAVTFFRAGNRLNLKKRFNSARLGLRFMAAFLLFVFAWGLFGEFEDKDNFATTDSAIVSGVNGIALAAISAKYLLAANTLVEDVNAAKCQPTYECWQTLGDEFVAALVEISATKNDSNDLLEAFLEISDEQLSSTEKEQLSVHLQQQIPRNNLNLPEFKNPFENPLKNAEEQVTTTNKLTEQIPAEKEEPKVGIIAWVESLIEDLGLGFGWAAFYFSIFTGWWKGQTPGKKLMGIKVIKLDGSTPTLWESFGRYGGYGAGFATGLLGFLQVYWDPNRQAIQDKISETLVIDLRIAKVPFFPEQNEKTQVALIDG